MAASSKGKQAESRGVQKNGRSSKSQSNGFKNGTKDGLSSQTQPRSKSRASVNAVASTSARPYAGDEDSEEEDDEDSEEEDDEDEDDSDMQDGLEDNMDAAEESPDEFAEDHAETSASGFAQYLGESDLDEGEDEDGDEDDSASDSGDAMDMDHRNGRDPDMDSQSGESEPDYDAAQEDLKKVPLETLLKAQRQLKKIQGGNSAKRVVKSQSIKAAEDADENDKSKSSSAELRKGRTESRRGLATELLNTHTRKAEHARKGTGERPSRDSKHAPAEQTSKRAVPRLRQVVEVKKEIRRDPRFDAQTSDKVELPHFAKSYSFLSDSRREEMAGIRKALAIAKKKKGLVDQNELDAMAQELTKLQSKEAEYQRAQRQLEVAQEWKKQENEKRRTGKGAFYLKDSDRKKLVEAKRMEHLQKDKFKLRKVMRRQGSKDKKKSFASAPPQRASAS